MGDCRRVSSNSDGKAILISNLNSKTVKFELDTGSTLTAISDCAYNTIFSDRDVSRLKPAIIFRKLSSRLSKIGYQIILYS